MWKTLAVAAFLGHALWGIVFAYIIWADPAGNRRAWTSVGLGSGLGICRPCEEAADNIAAASQMGRLDMVSLSLTIFGVTLGLVGLLGFGLVRSAAISAAETEAQAEMKRLAPQHIKDYMSSHGQALVTAAVDANILKIQQRLNEAEALVGGTEPDKATEIARRMGDTNGQPAGDDSEAPGSAPG